MLHSSDGLGIFVISQKLNDDACLRLGPHLLNNCVRTFKMKCPDVFRNMRHDRFQAILGRYYFMLGLLEARSQDKLLVYSVTKRKVCQKFRFGKPELCRIVLVGSSQSPRRRWLCSRATVSIRTLWVCMRGSVGGYLWDFLSALELDEPHTFHPMENPRQRNCGSGGPEISHADIQLGYRLNSLSWQWQKLSPMPARMLL